MAKPCVLDEARMAPLRACIADDWSLEEARPYVPFDPFADPDGFPLGCISKRTVAYSCGIVAPRDVEVAHVHPPREIARCQRLAASAMTVVNGIQLGMGSEGTPVFKDASGNIAYGSDEFSPFFIAALENERVPKRLTETVVRTKFRGVVFPKCVVRVEPLREKGEWWQSMLHACSRDEEEDRAPKLANGGE